ncbi:hypothetical protein F66182_4614 [Fusarium sp. NRRL 66182]|nr:hypothetical protein F66182_4614 [Fusarium sp. NRRL 66182]
MAAQAVPLHGRDVRHGKSGSASSLNYGPVPGSPTLTNPDMILPDYDCDVSFDDRSQSPIMLWNNGRPNDMRFHLPSPQNQFIAGPIAPSTPIIYGNGTMLSDIGEVTEVESVVGRGGRRDSLHLSVHSNEEQALRSSSILGTSRIKSRSQIMPRERKSSLDSNSTITSQGHGAPFVDFDDSASVDDVNFQGDDEESMASSYVEGTPAQESRTLRVPRPQATVEHRLSSSSLSDRAEQILANAKQRLTVGVLLRNRETALTRLQTMEGNLSRARISLYTPISDGSTPSPPIVRPATSLRESAVPGVPGQGHYRNLSESSFQNELTNSGFPQRSASALGAAGGYRQPLTSSRSADALGIGYGVSSHKTHLHALDTTLEALSEDEGGALGNSRRSSQNYNLQSPTFGSSTDTDMPRSASVAQVRDLKDQMKDLRGKISSLKEQARADSMKRRSLQSLRTPSPFTHARWDQGFLEPRRSQGSGPETPPWQAPWNHETTNDNPDIQNQANQDTGDVAVLEQAEAPDTESKDAPHALSSPENTNEVANVGQRISPPLSPELDTNEEFKVQENDDLNDDGETWEGDLDLEDEEYMKQEEPYGNSSNDIYDDMQEDDEEDEFVDFESESGESSYHDAFQNPVSHEDREDAFDYEHFFLHSAMGSMSQHRRESWSSVSSDDSVETTRGPISAPNAIPDPDPRRPSLDTMSSFETFATANEGRSSRISNLGDTAEATLETPEGSDGSQIQKRTALGGFKFPRSGASSRNGSVDFHQAQPRRNTVVHRPTSSAAYSARHRPSVSSFGSTGTNRSFPLVDRSKGSNGILTPTGSTPEGSPDSDLKQISETLLNEAACLGGIENGQNNGNSSAVQELDRESQILVERLVASLGKCVLGLTESSRAGSEARMYRRRIDAARRILDGLED